MVIVSKELSFNENFPKFFTHKLNRIFKKHREDIVKLSKLIHTSQFGNKRSYTDPTLDILLNLERRISTSLDALQRQFIFMYNANLKNQDVTEFALEILQITKRLYKDLHNSKNKVKDYERFPKEIIKRLDRLEAKILKLIINIRNSLHNGKEVNIQLRSRKILNLFESLIEGESKIINLTSKQILKQAAK